MHLCVEISPSTFYLTGTVCMYVCVCVCVCANARFPRFILGRPSASVQVVGSRDDDHFAPVCSLLLRFIQPELHDKYR